MADGYASLTNLRTDEVSLVPRGANKKTFAIAKGHPMKMDVLKALLDTPIENEAAAVEVFKGVSEKGQAALLGAVRILNAFREELPADAVVSIAKFAGYALPAADGEDELKKSLEKLSPALRSEMDRVRKSAEDAVKKSLELEAVLKAERSESVRKAFIARAAVDFGNLPGKADELGEVLKSVHDADAKLGERLETVLKAANAAIKGGALLKEIGTNQPGSTATGADKIDELAKARLEKTVGKETYYQAYAAVVKAHPELYAETLAPKGA